MSFASATLFVVYDRFRKEFLTGRALSIRDSSPKLEDARILTRDGADLFLKMVRSDIARDPVICKARNDLVGPMEGYAIVEVKVTVPGL